MKKFEESAHPESGAIAGVFADGTPQSLGQFRGGQKHGAWKYFFRNGRLKALGAYDDGKKVGEWTTYDREGAVKSSRIHRGPRS